MNRLTILIFSLLAGSIFLAAQGHDPSVVPKGVKSPVCSGRSVPQLENVVSKTGIAFRHDYVPEKKYIVESMGGGVILLDYDRDGWPDIYFTNNPSVADELKHKPALGALYHNNHDGTFTDVTAKSGIHSACYGMGGAVGDFDNDGWPDLYLTCLGGNVLYRNNGDGSFTDVTSKANVKDGRWSTGAAFGDYDNDGFLDLMVANYLDFKLSDLPGFGKTSTCRYRGIDVQCGPRGMPGAGDALFHNNGDGTFTDVSKAAGVDDPNGFYGLDVTWADFNNVGRDDIFVANDATPNFLYKNEGNGKFSEIGMESGTALTDDGSMQGTMGVAIGDYLHTGRLSIFITNFADQYNTLYRNEGDWNFRDVSFSSGLVVASLPPVKWGTSFVDLDNDGWLDLISVSGHVYPQVDTLSEGARYRERALLSMNQGDGAFCDASKQAGPALQEERVLRGLAVGDLFNDGNMDVVIEDLDGAPEILRNHGEAGAHWISFELQGTKSNRLAIGAKVKITAGKMTQMDEIRSGGSYLSQNDLRLHFG
ncbi:MAG TPA: CRTAC1 family protein, partial [Terriglobales bacterium]|nr:CRTAC1 family protein [Terriglobales bacterium]